MESSDSMDKSATVQSPCVGVCAIDEMSQLCQGCFRSLTEIQQWWDMAPAQQQAIVDAANARMVQLFK